MRRRAGAGACAHSPGSGSITPDHWFHSPALMSLAHVCADCWTPPPACCAAACLQARRVRASRATAQRALRHLRSLVPVRQHALEPFERAHSTNSRTGSCADRALGCVLFCMRSQEHHRHHIVCTAAVTARFRRLCCLAWVRQQDPSRATPLISISITRQLSVGEPQYRAARRVAFG